MRARRCREEKKNDVGLGTKEQGEGVKVSKGMPLGLEEDEKYPKCCIYDLFVD